MTRPKKKQSKEAEKRRKQRERAQSSRDAILRDMEKPSDAAWGTGTSAMGEVKRSSEEARLESCFECGFSGGRHALSCSRRPE